MKSHNHLPRFRVSSLIHAAVSVLICTGSPVGAKDPLPPWTNTTGKTIEAQFIRLEGETVIIRKNGTDFSIPMDILSPASQLQAKALSRASAPSSVEGTTNAPSPPPLTSIEPVEKMLVGCWQSFGFEDPRHITYNVSFDGLNGMKEWRYLTEGGIHGTFWNNQLVNYRLELAKNGIGVIIVGINKDGTEKPVFMVEQISEKVAQMRTIDPEIRKGNELISWKRASDQPYKGK